ncbi:hypothetical protein [Bifidobacterium sp.]|uniref:hypothetical protein n=1 Tax=Bifidobacterium sp. TaxID=41200 RepID=UPI002A90D683|nr:hypothetical protein [Bifidobacterium sp.]MDY5367684.1 hypothetical protein [Bifidobacterium sp.]
MDVSNRRRDPDGRFADEDKSPFDSVGDLTDAGEAIDGDVAVGLPGDDGLVEGFKIEARPTLRRSDPPGYKPIPRNLSDGLCPHTGKVAYPSEDNAAKALAIALWDSAIDPRRHEKSYYRCPTCHEWHLTSHDWGDAGSIRFDGVELAAQHRGEFYKGLAWLCPERKGEIPKDEYRAKRGSVHTLMRSFDRAGIPVEDWSNPWLWACARKATLPLDDGFEDRCKRFTLAARRLRSENPMETVRGDAKKTVANWLSKGLGDRAIGNRRLLLQSPAPDWMVSAARRTEDERRGLDRLRDAGDAMRRVAAASGFAKAG